MSQISFYVLGASGEVARLQFACRLAEKAYRMKNKVHIQAASKQAAEKLDDLLWTFRQGSFVPHELVQTGTDASSSPVTISPVTISYETAATDNCDLYINLGDAMPESASSFPRIAEILSSDEDIKLLGRDRFVHYRNDGHTLETHTL